MLLLIRVRVGSGVRIPDFRVYLKKKEPTAESADSSSGVRRNSMRVDEGRKRWSLLAIKMKARTVVGRGQKSLIS